MNVRSVFFQQVRSDLPNETNMGAVTRVLQELEMILSRLRQVLAVRPDNEANQKAVICCQSCINAIQNGMKIDRSNVVDVLDTQHDTRQTSRYER